MVVVVSNFTLMKVEGSTVALRYGRTSGFYLRPWFGGRLPVGIIPPLWVSLTGKSVSSRFLRF